MNLYLLVENSLFFLIATLFIVVVNWGWKHTKPYTLPLPFPSWYKIWFGSVQLLGVLLPLVFELVLWIVNYVIDVSQLPRLFRWEVKSNYSAVLSVGTDYLYWLWLICESC